MGNTHFATSTQRAPRIAQKGEPGEERMLACLQANRGSEPAAMLQKLLSSVQQFAAGAAQSDDVTALVLKYKRA